MSKHSEACCKIPPVIADNYTPKGKYIELNGLKTYVTGPSSAQVAILSVYDIFGFYPQTIQGADILAHGDADASYMVFIPDFFEGSPADLAWYPPDTDEKGAKLGEWFKSAAPPKHLPKIPGIVDAAQKYNENIRTWGIIGYCWGGKMTSLLAGKATAFKAAVQTSPAMVDAADAEKVQIPMMMLASKDEPKADVEKYDASLTVPKHVETFSDQVHGFMSARGDLNDSKGKAEYERGYQLALEFFHKHLV